MNRIAIELSTNQLIRLIGKLPLGEKIRLVRRLEQETLKDRWKTVFRDIDQRLKKFPVSQKDIDQEIKAYRKEKYAQGRN